MIQVSVTAIGGRYQVVVWRDRHEKVTEMLVDQHLVNGWEGAVVYVLDSMTSDPRTRVKL